MTHPQSTKPRPVPSSATLHSPTAFRIQTTTCSAQAHRLASVGDSRIFQLFAAMEIKPVEPMIAQLCPTSSSLCRAIQTVIRMFAAEASVHAVLEPSFPECAPQPVAVSMPVNRLPCLCPKTCFALAPWHVGRAFSINQVRTAFNALMPVVPEGLLHSHAKRARCPSMLVMQSCDVLSTLATIQ